MKKRVLIAMSGGVDSSAAAARLVEQGYDVVGVTMQVWDYSSDSCSIEEGNGTCCSSIDVEDARSVADKIGIPFYVVNCETRFKEKVIDDFVAGYLKGETPLPCVNCNTYLKFDHLIYKMKELNCDYLATGHYARIETTNDGEKVIVTSEDSWKDQTYFLFTIQKELVGKLLFPIGDWEKSKVRAYAEEKGLVVARKKDSTGICFIGKAGYAGFIEKQVPAHMLKSGKIRNVVNNEILGDHTGIHQFTIGQRKGVGIATGEPLYVVKLDAENGDVWMGPESSLYTSEVKINGINELAKIKEGSVLRVKIRYAHQGAKAKLIKTGTDSALLKFEEPQRAVTLGQAAVIYDGNILMGGGWIVK